MPCNCDSLSSDLLMYKRFNSLCLLSTVCSGKNLLPEAERNMFEAGDTLQHGWGEGRIAGGKAADGNLYLGLR